jgi:hypothetical protein
VNITTWAAFERAIAEADHLLEFHGARRTGRGRRYNEVSLNRAAVVFAIGAWQTFVESSVDELLRRMKPSPKLYGSGATDPGFLAATAEWQVARSRVRDAVGRFNSPTAENARRLYGSVGHDPFGSWAWTKGTFVTTSADTAAKLSAWVLVRHAIAHGAQRLPDVAVLAKTADGTPTLHKKNASACVQFIRQLVDQTDRGLAGF